MSHKYRTAIGRRRRRPASRGFLRNPNRGVEIADGQFRLPRAHEWNNSVFSGKNPGFAARREMPAVLLAGKGFLPP